MRRSWRGAAPRPTASSAAKRCRLGRCGAVGRGWGAVERGTVTGCGLFATGAPGAAGGRGWVEGSVPERGRWVRLSFVPLQVQPTDPVLLEPQEELAICKHYEKRLLDFCSVFKPAMPRSVVVNKQRPLLGVSGLLALCGAADFAPPPPVLLCLLLFLRARISLTALALPCHSGCFRPLFIPFCFLHCAAVAKTE